MVADMDNPNAEELVFSANFACPHCGYSVPELEPRLFSFNNPAGACPTCDGLGVQQFFDESRVVQMKAFPSQVVRWKVGIVVISITIKYFLVSETL